MSDITIQVGVTESDEILPVMPDDHGRGWVAFNTQLLIYPQNSDQAARVGQAFTALANSLAERELRQQA
jgi:hypothetical protein